MTDPRFEMHTPEWLRLRTGLAVDKPVRVWHDIEDLRADIQKRVFQHFNLPTR